MQKIKVMLALSVLAVAMSSAAQAQTENQDTTVVNIPESYQATQDQLTEDGSSGAASYNIDENNPAPVDQSAASWRAEEDEEELRVYSGSHDGNNFVKKMHVKVPVRNQDPYSSSSQYRRD